MQLQTIKKFTLKEEATTLRYPFATMTSSQTLNNLAHELYELEADHFREYFFCIFLNRANKVIGYSHIATGGLTGVVCDPRIIIAHAVQTLCTSMILVHNHPSGNIKPSTCDKSMTTKLQQATTYFDISVVDHLIICEDKHYYSFADEGIL